MLLQQERNHQQGHNIEDLDHRVNGRAGGIFVGVAYGVAGNGGFMGIGALATQVTVFDVFFGIVPGSATGGHGQGHEHTRNNGTNEQAAEGNFAQQEAHHGDSGSWTQALEAWADQELALGNSSILDQAVPMFERTMIDVALKHTAGRRRDAAALLGWGRNTLTRKIKELEEEPSTPN